MSNRGTGTGYFVKHGKRYISVGCDSPDLYDGLWIIETADYGRHHRNILGYIEDLPKPVNISKLVSAVRWENRIAQVIGNMYKSGKSPMDCATEICKELYRGSIACEPAPSAARRKRTQCPDFCPDSQLWLKM